MKTAIVYYSMSGNCAWTAERIASVIEADLIRIEPDKTYPDKGFKKFLWGGKSAVMGESPKLMPYTFSPEEYDRIIFGFPVWAGTITPPLRTFIRENREDLQEKKLAAFACMSGSGAEKALLKLKGELGVDALEAELILIDPKTKEDPANEDRIRTFCSALEPTD